MLLHPLTPYLIILISASFFKLDGYITYYMKTSSQDILEKLPSQI